MRQYLIIQIETLINLFISKKYKLEQINLYANKKRRLFSTNFVHVIDCSGNKHKFQH